MKYEMDCSVASSSTRLGVRGVKHSGGLGSWRGGSPHLLVMLFLGWTVFLSGCRIASPLPQTDLAAPGWSVRQGQAVWTASKGKEGVAGEILLATGGSNECFVQFTKPPFTLVTAQANGEGWSVELASERRLSRGRGKLPARVAWFALVNGVSGRPVGAGWRFAVDSGTEWHLTNSFTGEVLEGYFVP